jgi:hypothetical protein
MLTADDDLFDHRSFAQSPHNPTDQRLPLQIPLGELRGRVRPSRSLTIP